MKTIIYSMLLLSAVSHASTFEKLVTEISINSHGEASVSEMTSRYRVRLAEMNKQMDASENKKAVLQSYLDYANREILNQTRGSGIAFQVISRFHARVIKKFNAGQYEEARNDINLYFGTIVKFI